MHGPFELWNLSSRVKFDLPLVADETEHLKVFRAPMCYFLFIL